LIQQPNVINASLYELIAPARMQLLLLLLLQLFMLLPLTIGNAQTARKRQA